MPPLTSPEHFKPYSVPWQPEQKAKDIAVPLNPNSSQKKIDFEENLKKSKDFGGSMYI